nr:kinesin-like protein KIN-4C [Tanacetum cinerariifolium]
MSDPNGPISIGSSRPSSSSDAPIVLASLLVYLSAFVYVYASSAGSTSSCRIFDDCVAPLVDALFHGYNATVLAYGQTGSGKTYTMGTNCNGESTNGIIPKVMQKIFRHVEETKGDTEYLIKVSFIEIFKEEVFDLLESSLTVYSKADGNGKGTGPSRAPIQIRETANGGISLAGVTEAEVTSQEETASFLLRGSVCRATGSINMNTQSSRSHAIFTICMEQKRIAGVTSGGGHDDGGDDILSAKLHLVDLAGSERAKKTGADGMLLREGNLKKEGRKNEYEMHKLLALNQRQKMVLQCKTEANHGFSLRVF